jgi:Cu(I)/Ag(I) efflux system protein CusF
MKSKMNVLLAAAVLAMGGTGLGIAAADAPSVAQAAAAASAKLTAGEVRKVDTEHSKLTIRHEPIDNLDMPAMTMVFRVDAQLLNGVKAGDKIQFRAEQREAGFTVVKLEQVK